MVNFEGWLCIAADAVDYGVPVTKMVRSIDRDVCSLCDNDAEYTVVNALTEKFQDFLYCTECLTIAVQSQNESGDKWYAPATI